MKPVGLTILLVAVSVVSASAVEIVMRNRTPLERPAAANFYRNSSQASDPAPAIAQ